MLEETIRNWIQTSGVIVAIVGAILGAIKFFRDQKRERDVRMRELTWRKTEFVLKLAASFDNDPLYQRAVRMIDFGYESPTEAPLKLDVILERKTEDLTPKERELRFTVDHYLDFFDRLYHVIYVIKSLTPKDLQCFTWYVRRIGQVDVVREYAIKHGYEDVLRLHEAFEKYFQTAKESSLP